MHDGQRERMAPAKKIYSYTRIKLEGKGICTKYAMRATTNTSVMDHLLVHESVLSRTMLFRPRTTISSMKILERGKEDGKCNDQDTEKNISMGKETFDQS